MPNNGNNYRVKLEFASFLRGIPEFIIGSTELEAYVEVTIRPFHPNHFLAYFPRLPTPQRLIEQLFQASRYAHEKFRPSCPRNLFASRDYY